MASHNVINELTTATTNMSLHDQTPPLTTDEPQPPEDVPTSTVFKASITSNTMQEELLKTPAAGGDSDLTSPSSEMNTTIDTSTASTQAALALKPQNPSTSPTSTTKAAQMLPNENPEDKMSHVENYLATTSTTLNPPFTYDLSLAKHHTPAARYLAANPETQVLATGTAIFARSTAGKDHLLLVQRSPTDSYPNCWEIPGGSVDMTGETILDAAARELVEETGLHVTKFISELALTRFSTGRGNRVRWWNKFTFMVEVEEAQAERGDEEEKGETETIGTKVLLDEKEHQAWLWATEEDVRRCQCGSVPLNFVNNWQQSLMLEGFAQRKATSSSSSSSSLPSTAEHVRPDLQDAEPHNP